MLVELLISALIISAVATALAILMVIAEATIANYGEVKLKINDDKEIVTEGGSTLLSSLMNEKIFIPSACGGRGSCGFCKVKAKSGFSEHLPTELPWMNKQELKDNIRLACQVKVKNDVEIEIPEELFNVKEYEAEVVKITDLTCDIKGIRMKLIEPEEINFRPGQYIQFEAPKYELAEEPVQRAYSIASSPYDKNHVELIVKLVPEGICTTYIHKYLKVGDKVRLTGPYGDFYLSGTGKEVVGIAIGSGFAPINSILLAMAEKDEMRKSTYYFGARTKEGLFLENEMQELMERFPQYKFVPVISRPLPEDDWQGEKGRVTNMIERDIEENCDKEFYLCGSPDMIDAVVSILRKKNIPEENIFYDKFA